MTRRRPTLTVDVVSFSLINNQLHVLLMQRVREPFLGKLALPGGYVHVDEDTNAMDAARRIARQKVGLALTYMEQLGTFSGTVRDPRGWSASVVYIAMVRSDQIAADAAREFYPIAGGQPLLGLPELAFDHNTIIDHAVRRLRNKASYSTLPMFLMEPEFTLFELQCVYEAVMGSQIEKTSFRRKIRELGVIEPIGRMSDPKLTGTRPAEIYRAIDNRLPWLFNDTLG